MRYRSFGRLGWQVSEVGYGMWGMAGWTGSDDAQSRAVAAARRSRLGCNFFDTAWAYGEGHSERLLGELLRAAARDAASTPPPRSRRRTAPGPRGAASPSRTSSRPTTSASTRRRAWRTSGWSGSTCSSSTSGRTSGRTTSAGSAPWRSSRRRASSSGIGLSVNRWEPWNGLETLRTGLVDAVQVIYNVFDQAPEDELFPLCRELDVAVIARVPFDEGSLTGRLTRESRWPRGDFRNVYFGPENLGPTVERVEALRPLLPEGMELPELALRFILAEPAVSTVIPGMRTLPHVRANLGASDAGALPPGLQERLRAHRWDRAPTDWSL